MSEPDTPTNELPPAVEAAFAALIHYDRGSPRGDLVPLDEAAKRSLDQPAEMARLEERLTAVLRSDAPLPAKEYVCRKLTLLGSTRCVPVLAPLLQTNDLADAARGVLEVLPCDAAAAALRDSLAKLTGAALAGAVTSLGARREQASVPLLTPLLHADDPAVVASAVVALGRIGGATASRALQVWQPEAPSGMGALVADALSESQVGAEQGR
ncbi:MAG: HEAT repeat domain-containing protein [Verrucomicrobiae bacterium]|nr:HEAT repeat domain-containing protein [Verrucomicrobiae bacterium]MCP5521899.1 HEAT repeat domain-containing protein [Verrucomicrobiales bacterium]